MTTATADRRKTARRAVIAEVVQRVQQILKTVDLFSRRTLRQFGVTGPQIWALRTIDAAGSLSTGELADRMFLHDSTISGILDRLEERGLVTRERGDDDRRVIRLRVTRSGLDILCRAPEPPRSRLPRGLQKLDRRELRRMRDAVRQLALIMRVDDLDPDSND